MENAKITDVKFTYEFNILTFYLTLESNPWTQVYGGYSIALMNLQWLDFLMKTFKVNELNQLINMNCRVKRDADDKIIAIGHIIEDMWFSFSEFMKD
jgi:hypothetical protein